MNKQDKELLLRDLSARLPYGVCCYWRIGSELTLNLTEYSGWLTCINKVKIEDSDDCYWDCYFADSNDDISIGIAKPYLRPMSSMTEEEKKVYCKIEGRINFPCKYIKLTFSVDELDWLNAHHFDYRGLIEKDLALEAPEGMYDLNKE